MIGTVFAPEPLPTIEALRALIQGHRGSHYEILVYRCSLFYQEALVELHCRNVEKTNVIRACMEALLSASACILEYQTVLSDPVQSRSLGNLAVYAFLQALTQIVEAMTGLEKALSLDFVKIFGHKNGNKEREYWKFRNRHSHVVNTRASNRTPGDPEGADNHAFRLGRNGADRIHYTTLAVGGFMGRSISTNQIAWELQSDLNIFFDAALAALRDCSERR